MNFNIAITALGSVSPLGGDQDTIWNNYLKEEPLFESRTLDSFVAKDMAPGKKKVLVGPLHPAVFAEIEQIKASDSKYKSLDASVLYALAASRQAISCAGWQKGTSFGINLGSSRGATALFELYHKEFIETGLSATLASPTTTLGNISSWVAHDLQSQGPEISHSITCSTGLHAILNGVAWLRSGMATQFMAGASEAPLTPFTIAQMQALKIYAQDDTLEFPCRALDLDKTRNTMVLAEAAAVVCMESGRKQNALAHIEGIGYATEVLQHNISISTEADCFQKSMAMALKGTPLDAVDVIVMHAPGTIKGDLSEYYAIQKVFGQQLPMLTTNKWKIGHSFGTSGMLSLEFAILMLQRQKFIGVPFWPQKNDKPIEKILVNAVGFGGNAVSILIGK